MIEIELEGFITIYGKLIEIKNIDLEVAIQVVKEKLRYDMEKALGRQVSEKELEDQLRLSIYYHSKARMAKRDVENEKS